MRNNIRQAQVALFKLDSALLALVNIELPLDARPPIPSKMTKRNEVALFSVFLSKNWGMWLKINQITHYIMIPIALLQAWGQLTLLNQAGVFNTLDFGLNFIIFSNNCIPK